MTDLLRLKNVTKDIGIIGKKGTFKSTILNMFLFLNYKYNKCTILANYHPNFPHIYCDSIDDYIEKVRDTPGKKMFGGDDFERIFNNRMSSSRLNLSLNDILLDWRKHNCSLIWTSKRDNVDIGLREGTSEFWFPTPTLQQQYTQYNEEIRNILKKYSNFIQINIERYDENLDELPTIKVKNIRNALKLFETTEIIKGI